VALAASLGLAAVSLTQCRLAGDTVTGVDRANSGFNATSDCVQRCNDKYKACREAEDARYRAALRNCDLKPADQRRACKEGEERLHQQNQDDCVRAMQLCKKNCEYREGSGNGGR
jgi:hypothetical protein